MKLLTKLLRLSLSGPEEGTLTLTAADLPQAPGAWEALCEEARNHRLQPLFSWVLGQHGLHQAVPEPQRSTLLASHRGTLRVNMLHWWIMSQVLPALEEQGIRPILFKGMVLSDAYYPELGARSMADIDLLIQPSEYAVVAGVLAECGSHPAEARGGHATDFRGPLGVAIDLHEEFTLFPTSVREEITEDLPMTSLGGQSVRTWEPNAMLIHLVVHLRGHRPKTGLLLGWLMDMAFLVQKRGDDFCSESLEALAPTPEDTRLLWRSLGFLQAECGLPLPPDLEQRVATHEPLSLVGIRRDRRLALWRLPSLKGWMCMLASGVGARQRPVWRFPRPGELARGLLPGGRD